MKKPKTVPVTNTGPGVDGLNKGVKDTHTQIKYLNSKTGLNQPVTFLLRKTAAPILKPAEDSFWFEVPCVITFFWEKDGFLTNWNYVFIY